ncbi:MAG: thioredoxin family protein [Chthoniobacteraceae bacterium]
MKKLALLFALAFASSTFAASDETWLTDLPKAQEKAKAEKKMVLIDFTGSDWCPPCKGLHSKVLTSAEFIKFAKDNLVLVEIDFPKSKPQSDELKAANKELSQKFGVRGYPTVIVLDADGKEVFKKVGYGGTPAKDYVAELAKLKK